MTIDTAMLGIIITLLMGMLAGGVYVGRLSEKVKGNRTDIDAVKKEAHEDRERNSAEHSRLYEKLETLAQLVRNGGR